MSKLRWGFVTNSSSSSFIFKATDKISTKNSLYSIIREIILESESVNTPIEQIVRICETIEQFDEAIYNSINYSKFEIVDHRVDKVDKSFIYSALDSLSDANYGGEDTDWFSIQSRVNCTKNTREGILEFGEFGVYFESGTFSQWVFDKLYELSSEYTFK